MEKELTKILKNLIFATGGNTNSIDETAGISIAISEITSIFTSPPTHLKRRNILK